MTTRKPAARKPSVRKPAASGSASRGKEPVVRKAAPASKATGVVAESALQSDGAVAPELRKGDRPKLVRDSFTMPQADFDLIAALKQRALGFQRPAKKSELLRAGLHALAVLSDRRLQAALDALVPLKPGRPKKGA